MSKVALVVELEIDEKHLKEFLDIVTAHGANSQKIEEGCLRFEVLKPREGENRVILAEVYSDDAALEAHWNSEHMAAYREKVSGMIVSRVAHRCDFA
ncbi:MAG: putative quinol monooxygenase [Gammaproteobacteria bacterium]|nr:putative quinol monooxygenase [Gammaproteobacteria bacterium]